MKLKCQISLDICGVMAHVSYSLFLSGTSTTTCCFCIVSNRNASFSLQYTINDTLSGACLNLLFVCVIICNCCNVPLVRLCGGSPVLCARNSFFKCQEFHSLIVMKIPGAKINFKVEQTRPAVCKMVLLSSQIFKG